MVKSDDNKNVNSFAMTFCDGSQNGIAFAMALCDASQSDKTFAMALCDTSQNDKAFATALCDASQTDKAFATALCDTSQNDKTFAMAVCDASHNLMQFFAPKRTIRGSHTPQCEAVSVPALPPRLIHSYGITGIHPKNDTIKFKSLSQGFLLEREERRERHYGCGWPLFSLKMKNVLLASNCHTSEVSAVATRLVALYQGLEFPEDSYLTNAMADFISLSERITVAVDRSVYTAYGTEDKNRCQCLRSFHHLLVSSKGSQDAVVRNSAMAIAEIFKPYGLAILRKGLDEKTGHINALLTNLGEDAMQPHVANIPGMADCLAQLQNAQTAFEAKRAEYQTRRGAMRSSDSATALKGQILVKLNSELIPYFHVMDTAKGGSYSEFYTMVCQVVESANVTASLHRGRKKAAAKDETVSEPLQPIEEGGLSA